MDVSPPRIEILDIPGLVYLPPRFSGSGPRVFLEVPFSFRVRDEISGTSTIRFYWRMEGDPEFSMMDFDPVATTNKDWQDCSFTLSLSEAGILEYYIIGSDNSVSSA